MLFMRRRSLFSLLLVLFYLSALGIAFAQKDPRPSVSTAPDVVSRMQRVLNLTEDQVVQVTAIISEQKAQIGSLMSSGKGRPDMSQIEAIRQQMEAKLSRVLTAEQFVQWKSGAAQGNRSAQAAGGRSNASGDSSVLVSGQSRSTNGSGVW